MGHYIHIERYDGDELEFVADSSLQDTQQYFTDELNEILEEENIAFHFVHGQFQRRGYAQTQKNIQRVGSVLGHPNLGRVRDYYNQARKDFDKHPEPDLEHCVLLCMQALEACLEILTGKPASNDFLGVSSKLQGNGPKQIPPPIVTAMTKLYAYRGSGKGVAHAALEGNRVEEHDAELVLSVTAAYITYLVALLLEEDEIPF